MKLLILSWGEFIPKRKIEDLLHLRTKTWWCNLQNNGETYVQTDGAAMTMTNISMVELENTIIIRLENKI